MSLALILLIVALVLFALDAIAVVANVRLVSLGLAFLTGALIAAA